MKMIKYVLCCFLGGILLIGCRSDQNPSVFYNRLKFIKLNGKLKAEFFFDEQQRLKEWKTYFSDEVNVFSSFKVFRNDSGQVVSSENWSVHSASSSDAPVPGKPLKLEDKHFYYYDQKGRLIKILSLQTQSPSGNFSTVLFAYNSEGKVQKSESFNVEGKLIGYSTLDYLVNPTQQKRITYNPDGIFYNSFLVEYDNANNPFFLLNVVLAMVPVDAEWISPNNMLTSYSIDKQGNKAATPTIRCQIEYNDKRMPTKKTMFYANTSTTYEYLYE